jgi:hypothetical protein
MDRQSAGAGVRLVALTSIVVDPRAWPRSRYDEDRVALFANLYEEQGLAEIENFANLAAAQFGEAGQIE